MGWGHRGRELAGAVGGSAYRGGTGLKGSKAAFPEEGNKIWMKSSTS